MERRELNLREGLEKVGHYTLPFTARLARGWVLRNDDKRGGGRPLFIDHGENINSAKLDK